jgi:hypothetical protein
MEHSRTSRVTKDHKRQRLAAPLVASGLIVLGTAGGMATTALSQAPKTSQRQQPREVDYRRPSRQYEKVKLEGASADDVSVWVEKQLKADAPAIAERALARLKATRDRALAVVPNRERERLAKIPFFLLYGPKARNGGRDNGLEYFQKQAPDHHAKLDATWRHAIVIYCAQNYVDITDLWALKSLFHEFAHAYQLANWPENQPDIMQAWEHARDNNLYRNVQDVQTKRTLASAYALTNQLEYFAELSCMYFVKCNYEPSDRKKLKEYDPVGFAMIRKMWDPE